MSNLPDKIEIEFETNEGSIFSRRDDDILRDLVNGFNELIDYLEAKS